MVVSVDAHLAELAADVLWRFGPAAVEEQTEGSIVRLLAGFATAAEAALAAGALADAGLGRPEVEPVADDGLDGWRAWARPVTAGPFLVIPAWLAGTDPEETASAPAGTLRLVVDPGRTFGSGSHPTTRLVLARLAALVQPGDRVLDVGCGSGILAVGAALAGAGAVEGIDLDPLAPAATAANAAANGVAGRVAASDQPLAAVAARPGAAGRFAVVLANLLAPVVVELARDLAAVVEPGGHLVVSGLLADRWDEVITVVRAAADPAHPLAVADVATEDGWAAVTLARPLP